jgi:hypothetical protein
MYLELCPLLSVSLSCIFTDRTLLTCRLDLRSQDYTLLALRSKGRVRVGQDWVEPLHEENLICLFKLFAILGKKLILFDRRRRRVERLCEERPIESLCRTSGWCSE